MHLFFRRAIFISKFEPCRNVAVLDKFDAIEVIFSFKEHEDL